MNRIKKIIKHIPKDRKLWICVIMFITSVVFIFTKNIDFTQWSQFLKYTFIIFTGTMAIDKINKNKKSNWKSKKLWIFFLLYFASVVMVFIKFAQFDQWSQFVNWLYGAYSATNVGTSFIRGKNKSQQESST